MRKRLAAGTTMVAVLLTPTAALGQEVVVEPLEAAVGDLIGLRGAGCPVGEPVDVFLADAAGDPIDVDEEALLADAQGAFEARELVVPEAALGDYVVVVECGDERFEAPFALRAAGTETPTATPEPAPTGDATTGTTGGAATGTDTSGTGTTGGATTGTDTNGTDTSGTDTGTGAATGGDQVQAPTGGVETGMGGGAHGPALALAAGGLMLVAGAGLTARTVRTRG